MSDPYLIAHKVRGEPAFDVAIQMECPECFAQGCGQCDDLGYWWIIPTSGHRAYPFWSHELPAMMEQHPTIGWEIHCGNLFSDAEYTRIGQLPNVPDHYPDHGTAPRINLIEALGLKPAAPAKIDRRI
jgi:hypothetical protein